MGKMDGGSFRLLILIAVTPLAERAAKMLSREKAPIRYELASHGTASSEIMDVLGLGSIEKTVLAGMMPRNKADLILKKLHGELRLDRKNSGIAFTVPITGGNRRVFERMEEITGRGEEDEASMRETNYAMIAVFANQGFSEEIMTAARSAGATGGTVIASRGLTDEKLRGTWGFLLQPEKEIVLILTAERQRMDIMRAVNISFGPASEAGGIVISVPVENVLGMDEAMADDI